MTSTTIDKGRWAPATGVPGFSYRGLRHKTVRAVRDWIGPFGFMTALKHQSTIASPKPDHGLAAISNYVQFIAAHPDMPIAHKDRFLGEIMRCCRELRTASS